MEKDSIAPELLAILACPRCHGNLTSVQNETSHAIEGLHCPVCSVVYPVKENVPLLLADESVPAAQFPHIKHS